MNTIKVFLDSGGRTADVQKDFPLYQGQFQNKLINVYVPAILLSPNLGNQHFIGQYTANNNLPTNQDLNTFVFTQVARGQEQGDLINVIFINGNTTTLYNYTYDSENKSWDSVEVNYFTPSIVGGTSVNIGSISLMRDGTEVKSPTRPMRFVKKLTYNEIEYALYERLLPKEFTYYSGNTNMVINVVNVDVNNNSIIDLITSQICTFSVLPSSILDKDETVEPSIVDELSARINVNASEILKKQDNQDNGLLTENKSVIGAINELYLKPVFPENYIGTYEYNAVDIDDLPTDEELVTFIKSIKGVTYSVKTGDVVIVEQKIETATDRLFKYIFNGDEWSHYEIQNVQPAENGVSGLIKGTYGYDNFNVLVNIGGGKITEIYVKQNESYVALSQAFMPLSVGASKQYVKDYALPKEFNNIFYLTNNGYKDVLDTDYEEAVSSSSIGSTLLGDTEFTLSDLKLQLANKNAFRINYNVLLEKAETLTFNLEVVAFKNNVAKPLAQYVSETYNFNAGDYKVISFAGAFNYLTEVLNLGDGDRILFELRANRTSSFAQTYTIMSNSTTPSSFYLYTNVIGLLNALVVNGTGESETNAMSQKATTEFGTPTSIDLTSSGLDIAYDTTNGLQVSATVEDIRDNGNVVYYPVSFKIPLIAGDYTNIDESEGGNKLIIKVNGKDLIEDNLGMVNNPFNPVDGEELNTKFASEIATYSDVWAWIKARITAGNFKGIFVGDYITWKTTDNQTFHSQIAGINCYKDLPNSLTSDYESAWIGNHIDFITKEVTVDVTKFNLARFNNGIGCDKFTAVSGQATYQLTHRTATTYPSGLSKVLLGLTTAPTSDYSYNSTTGILTFSNIPSEGTIIKAVWSTPVESPFVASNVYAWLNSEKCGVANEALADPTLIEVDYTNSGVWNTLPTALQNVIIDKIIYGEAKYTQGTLMTAYYYDSKRLNMGKLWLPYLEELGRNSNPSIPTIGNLLKYPLYNFVSLRKKKSSNAWTNGWFVSDTSNTASNTVVSIAKDCGASSIYADAERNVPICFRIGG